MPQIFRSTSPLEDILYYQADKSFQANADSPWSLPGISLNFLEGSRIFFERHGCLLHDAKVSASRCSRDVSEIARQTCSGGSKIEQWVACWEEHEQCLWLAIGNASGEPGVKLADIGLQGDAAKPPIQTEIHSAQSRSEVAQHNPHCDRYPAAKATCTSEAVKRTAVSLQYGLFFLPYSGVVSLSLSEFVRHEYACS